MSELKEKLDVWADGGAAALVLEQPLRPVVGTLVFPPTFAPARKGDPSDYIIDDVDGQGVVTLDTPGAEANRLEPLFLKPPLAELVPQITITAGNQQKNLLELGHRAADALVRSVKDKAPIVEQAFEQVLVGDHSALAAFAPTSLVFGAWDSRGTGAKLPRLLEARVDAYGVEKRNRAAQYFAAVDYVETGLLDQSKDKKELVQRSQAGFRDSPSGRQPGGVEIVEGGKGIVRTLTVHLAGIHRLGAGADVERGRLLRQYVLGLALAAVTAPLPLFLRQGCSLVPPNPKNGENAPRWSAVGFEGSEDEFDLPHDEIISYTRAARDRLFPKGLKNETWSATKTGAQAEVKKRAKSDDEAGAAARP
ncbi:MAG TPA: type I-U CRISPR-associated RAMP protein Csb1/Cas7u [Stellaceae bacterium]|nr:type I-U CRISPR-associated RAMP protein Csb1/Cas7u [Stellaceae bacterium]